MNRQQQLTYLAGYIDGDGCFRANITTQKQGAIVYERSITITSVKEEPIIFFKNLVGGFIFTDQKEGNRRRIYVWTVKNKDALNAAKEILPFLVLKKNLCKFFITYCENIFPKKTQKLNIDILEIRNFLLKQIKNEIRSVGLIEKNLIDEIKENGKKFEPLENDFIYLAGLIDSEGCFRVSKRFRKSTAIWIYNTCLEIGNTRIEIIKWLYERFGGSITYIHSKRKNRRNSAIWSCHAKILYPILIKVVDYLINKKEVCNELIKFQSTILKNGGDRHSASHKETYKAICQERELIIERIHKLNQKGLQEQVPSGCHGLCSL
jgi:hypothetical protein